MQRFWTRERLKTLIVFLILCAIVDSGLLMDNYVAANADTVTIVAVGHDGYQPMQASGTPVPLRSIQSMVRLRFTGKLARRIQKTINDYPFFGTGCTLAGTDAPYRYEYTLTFTLGGVTVESAHTETEGCVWTVVTLGLPSGILPGTHPIVDAGDVIVNTINSLTHGAFPTPEYPIYA